MIFEFSRGNEVVATMRADNLSGALERYAKALCLEGETVAFHYNILSKDCKRGGLTLRIFDAPVDSKGCEHCEQD